MPLASLSATKRAHARTSAPISQPTFDICHATPRVRTYTFPLTFRYPPFDRILNSFSLIPRAAAKQNNGAKILIPVEIRLML
ncbi:hypothetical protein CEXT_715021 [Caerostris extrusa]|uniref:Uncharacterized protein n=1 Tax=Caerostris extrusa TaxID=172846 RepID=A0AAV4N2S1_CAEEX|nr:hypothetical protein CEXT_715021 [Caerostris extrusa]